jgi:hypothetical protein
MGGFFDANFVNIIGYFTPKGLHEDRFLISRTIFPIITTPYTH